MQSNPVLDKMMIEYAKLHIQLVIANETVQKLGQENAQLQSQLKGQQSVPPSQPFVVPAPTAEATDAVSVEHKDSIGE